VLLGEDGEQWHAYRTVPTDAEAAGFVIILSLFFPYQVF
jgi:hypothetical protein